MKKAIFHDPWYEPTLILTILIQSLKQPTRFHTKGKGSAMSRDNILTCKHMKMFICTTPFHFMGDCVSFYPISQVTWSF